MILSIKTLRLTSLLTRLKGPTWGQLGPCQPQMGPMLAPWTLLPGLLSNNSIPQIRKFQWLQLDFGNRSEILPHTWLSSLPLLFHPMHWCRTCHCCFIPCNVVEFAIVVSSHALVSRLPLLFHPMHCCRVCHCCFIPCIVVELAIVVSSHALLSSFPLLFHPMHCCRLCHCCFIPCIVVEFSIVISPWHQQAFPNSMVHGAPWGPFHLGPTGPR